MLRMFTAFWLGIVILVVIGVFNTLRFVGSFIQWLGTPIPKGHDEANPNGRF